MGKACLEAVRGPVWLQLKTQDGRQEGDDAGKWMGQTTKNSEFQAT